MTHDEWVAEGTKRFGPDMMTWRFVCPSCGHVQTAADYKAAGAPINVVAFSCIGRWLTNGADDPKRDKKLAKAAFKKKGGPCNYAGGGLFKLNPVEVDGQHCFAFAETT